jgi:hypothetical protein
MKVELIFHPEQSQFKMDQSNKVRPESLKLLGKKIGKTLEDLGIGNDILNRYPTSQGMRARIKFA